MSPKRLAKIKTYVRAFASAAEGLAAALRIRTPNSSDGFDPDQLSIMSPGSVSVSLRLGAADALNVGGQEGGTP